MTLEPIFTKALALTLKPTTEGIWNGIVGSEIIDRREYLKTALEPVLIEAADEVARTIEQVGTAEIDQITTFIVSPAVEIILKEIFCASILEMEKHDLDQIQEKFLKLFALHTEISEEELEDSAPQIFQSLIDGCQATFDHAINLGLIAPLNGKMNLYHRDLKNHFKNVENTLALIAKPNRIDIQQINDFVTAYRGTLVKLYSTLTPPFFDTERIVSIKEIYVEPKFKPNYISKEKSKSLSVSLDLTSGLHRMTVLGDPGAGKSVYAQKLIVDFASNPPQKKINGRQVTPILVILRDYAAYKQKNNCSLLHFIESTISSKYQINLQPDVIEYLLLNGYLVIIFDGLDELLDPAYRREIRDDIQLFCYLYSSTPAIVTSRIVGYQEAPLDPEVFENYKLVEFSNTQTIDYVTKWFNLNKQVDKEQREKSISSFLEESKDLSDIRSNPLLLALMCNIYKTEGYIPQSRAELYEKCTKMLISRWDLGIKRLEYPEILEQIKSKIERLMGYLANWIYGDNNLEQGVTENRLVDKAVQYLCPKYIEDIDEAKEAAQIFFQYCRGRAWVFTSVGIDNKYGEELYRFTHRTFLEYFAAYDYVRIYPNSAAFLNKIAENIKNGESWLVCQIAIQIKNKISIDAEDEILCYLIEIVENETKNTKKWNILNFIVSCLEFVIPSHEIIKKIITLIVNSTVEFSCCAQQTTRRQGITQYYYQLRPWDLLDGLVKAHKENYRNIDSSLKKNLESILSSSSSNNLKIDICLEISDYLSSTYINRPKKYLLNDYFENQIRQRSTSNSHIAMIAFSSEMNRVSDFVDNHGIQKCFDIFKFSFCIQAHYNSIAFYLLEDYIYYFTEQQKFSSVEELSYLGNQLIEYNFPLKLDTNKFSLRETSDILRANPPSTQEKELKFDQIAKDYPNALFAAFVIFAIYLEVEHSFQEAANLQYDFGYSEGNGVLKKIHDDNVPFFNYTRYLFISRYTDPDKYQQEIEEQLSKCRFNIKQKQFVRDWIDIKSQLFFAIFDSST